MQVVLRSFLHCFLLFFCSQALSSEHRGVNNLLAKSLLSDSSIHRDDRIRRLAAQNISNCNSLKQLAQSDEFTDEFILELATQLNLDGAILTELTDADFDTEKKLILVTYGIIYKNSNGKNQEVLVANNGQAAYVRDSRFPEAVSPSESGGLSIIGVNPHKSELRPFKYRRSADSLNLVGGFAVARRPSRVSRAGSSVLYTERLKIAGDIKQCTEGGRACLKFALKNNELEDKVTIGPDEIPEKNNQNSESGLLEQLQKDVSASFKFANGIKTTGTMKIDDDQRVTELAIKRGKLDLQYRRTDNSTEVVHHLGGKKCEKEQQSNICLDLSVKSTGQSLAGFERSNKSYKAKYVLGVDANGETVSTFRVTNCRSSRPLCGTLSLASEGNHKFTVGTENMNFKAVREEGGNTGLELSAKRTLRRGDFDVKIGRTADGEAFFQTNYTVHFLPGGS